MVPIKGQRFAPDSQDGLFRPTLVEDGLDYRPHRPDRFEPQRIILTKGSLVSPSRRTFIERICGLFPQAEVLEQLDLPHNRINVGSTDPLAQHYLGKRMLVLGEHRSAVRLSREYRNMCPNYWHFSPYGFCPFDCAYCYLAATPGVRFSPTVKIFLNLPEILAQIGRIAQRLGRPTAFYLGKLQDGLALDPLTGYSRVMVPFFAQHPYARLTLLTKASDVENLLDLDHRGHTILSWSLNPPEVCARFEVNTPPPQDRIEAMRICAAAGYPIRAVIMPVIPVPGWREVYAQFLQELLTMVPLTRITLGGICSYEGALSLMESKLGMDNVVSQRVCNSVGKCADGRRRYRPGERVDIYQCLIDSTRRFQPALRVALCLEERAVFDALNLGASAGRCNCVL